MTENDWRLNVAVKNIVKRLAANMKIEFNFNY